MAAMQAKINANMADAPLSLSVTKKRTLYLGNIRGTGNWGITLTKEQWLRLLDYSDNIKTFIKHHDDDLA